MDKVKGEVVKVNSSEFRKHLSGYLAVARNGHPVFVVYNLEEVRGVVLSPGRYDELLEAEAALVGIFGAEARDAQARP